MALLIQPNGKEEIIKVPKKNQLEFLQKLVGGYIEIVSINHLGYSGMIVNEEGKLLNLPYNPLASHIFTKSNKSLDSISGVAILFKNNEID